MRYHLHTVSDSISSNPSNADSCIDFSSDFVIAYDPAELGPGPCQFAALAHQLKLLSPNNTTVTTPLSHSDLRNQIADYLETKPTLGDNSQSELQGFVVGQTWSYYISNLRLTRTHGDHVTLQAASQILNVRILVIYSEKSSPILISPVGTDMLTIAALPLLMVGYYPEHKREHYVSIRLKSSACESDAITKILDLIHSKTNDRSNSQNDSSLPGTLPASNITEESSSIHQSSTVFVTHRVPSPGNSSQSTLLCQDSSKLETGNKKMKRYPLYKGVKLDLDHLVKEYTELEKFEAIKNSKSRVHVSCKLCNQYIDEAKKLSKNGTVPLASGVRADGDERLKRIVDHLQSEMHTACKQREKLDLEWNKSSDKHPWLKVLTAHKADLVKFLVTFAFDVYNDSLCETVSAYSWPSRSLTVLAAERLNSLMRDEGPDAALPPFIPAPSNLHYRDPTRYRDMLQSVNAVEVKRVSKMFDDCIAFSIQIDGSVNKQMEDDKFTSCRMVMQDGSLRTLFLLMHSPEQNGAHGLLESVNESLKICGHNSHKLMGITTDGESANTGKKAGLWKLLSDQLQREILTFWCCAHRSDLAAEAIIAAVPELTIWKANLLALATSFRTSKNKTKLLHTYLPQAKQFPRHHEVRFAQHQVQLIDATLCNLPGCKDVWKKLEETGDRKEKCEARGFLKTWNGKQIWMTEVMGDILSVFQTLQKQFQRDDLILCDVLTCRDSALGKLELMQRAPYPGKRESISTFKISEDGMDAPPGRGVRNDFVTTNNRNAEAIRIEIVQAAYNFLAERLNCEQDRMLKAMQDMLSARYLAQFVNNGLILSAMMFPGEDGQFTDDVCEQWKVISDVPYLPVGTDLGCSLSVRLRQLLPITTGLVQRVLAAIATLSPHSMQTERIVSHHNLIVDDHRTCMNAETVNSRLNIALNGVGTAYYDPRPAVVHFLGAKERRVREPENDIYSQRDFVKKFFRETGHFV